MFNEPLILSLCGVVRVCCPAVLLSAEWIVSCRRITCIQPLSRCSLMFFFLFRKCFWFVFLSFPLLFHHVFFLSLAYWPFHTRLLACLIRAAILHFSFCLHLFTSRCCAQNDNAQNHIFVTFSHKFLMQ